MALLGDAAPQEDMPGGGGTASDVRFVAAFHDPARQRVVAVRHDVGDCGALLFGEVLAHREGEPDGVVGVLGKLQGQGGRNLRVLGCPPPYGGVGILDTYGRGGQGLRLAREQRGDGVLDLGRGVGEQALAYGGRQLWPQLRGESPSPYCGVLVLGEPRPHRHGQVPLRRRPPDPCLAVARQDVRHSLGYAPAVVAQARRVDEADPGSGVTDKARQYVDVGVRVLRGLKSVVDLG